MRICLDSLLAACHVMPNGNGKTFFCHWSRPDSERNKKPIKIKEALVLTFRSNLGLCHPTTELA